VRTWEQRKVLLQSDPMAPVLEADLELARRNFDKALELSQANLLKAKSFSAQESRSFETLALAQLQLRRYSDAYRTIIDALPALVLRIDKFGRTPHRVARMARLMAVMNAIDVEFGHVPTHDVAAWLDECIAKLGAVPALLRLKQSLQPAT
jgi:hypothetical protein